MKLTESGYIFIQSGVLNQSQLEFLISNSIDIITNNFNTGECDFHINVVTNKEGKIFGHSYGWISNIKVFNIMVGLNIDGTERYEEVEDENWSPPENDEQKAMEGITSWSDLTEIEESYERPMIKVKQEPLFIFPGIKHTEEQFKNTGQEIGFIEVSEAKFRDKNNCNIIFSTEVENTFNLEIFNGFFSKFEKDKNIHTTKNKKFYYPILSLKNKKLVVKFSPLYKNTASFLINVIKKTYIYDTNNNKKLFFFSQVKKK